MLFSPMKSKWKLVVYNSIFEIKDFQNIFIKNYKQLAEIKHEMIIFELKNCLHWKFVCSGTSVWNYMRKSKNVDDIFDKIM